MGRSKVNPHFRWPGMVGDYRFLCSCDLVLELDEMRIVADSGLLGDKVSQDIYDLLAHRERRLKSKKEVDKES